MTILESSVQTEVVLSNDEMMTQLVGTHNQHLAYIEEHCHVSLSDRGESIQIMGDDESEVEKVKHVLEALKVLIRRGIRISLADVVTALKMADKGTLEFFTDLYEETIFVDYSGKPIRVKTLTQKQYIEAIKKYDVVFGIGPAGTGKTFLAVVMAAKALKNGQVKRIVLTRPAVEAGENLGFLPGDLKEKIDPYLRPLYDALYTVFGRAQTDRLIERGIIEIAPLAYMRGRTLDDAFVILDEAQNTTKAQMKMFLTRLGYHSKMIINGDQTQIDLPKHTMSGLLDAEKKLRQVSAIKFMNFKETDVIRHPVVADIIAAYNRDEN